MQHPSYFSFKSPEFRNLAKILRLGKQLGTGKHSAVFDNGDDTVTKITTDHTWLDYAEQCNKLPNCVRGAVLARDALQCNGVPLSIARMPKYTAPIPNSELGREATSLRKLRAVAERWLLGTIASEPELDATAPLSARLLRGMTSLGVSKDHHKTLIGMAKFVEAHPIGDRMVLDLHHKNLMVDAGRLVIIDPFNVIEEKAPRRAPVISPVDSLEFICTDILVPEPLKPARVIQDGLICSERAIEI